MARAFSPASPPTAEMVTRPLSSMLILAPVASWIPRMVLPLGPMTSPILSGLICIVKIRGAYWDSSVRGSGSALAISFRMWRRPFRAFSSACFMMSRSRPRILMSIWIEVMPFSVPATLKSMSPSASSQPRMSVRMATLSPSLIETHRDAGAGRLHRHARIHERERAAAHASPSRRSRSTPGSRRPRASV